MQCISRKQYWFCACLLQKGLGCSTHRGKIKIAHIFPIFVIRTCFWEKCRWKYHRRQFIQGGTGSTLLAFCHDVQKNHFKIISLKQVFQNMFNNSNDFFLQSLFQVIILWTSSPLIWKMTLVSNAKLGLRMESLQLGRDMLLWQCWYLLRLPNCYRQENFSKPSRADKWNWDASQEVENPLQRYVVVGNWTFKVSSKREKN